MSSRRITEDEVNKLYQEYKTPRHVIGHCKEVTRVALTLGKVLNEHGYNLDLDLIKGAGLTHDVARTEEEHWNVGAKALEKLGYIDEAKIVKVHMHYPAFNSINNLDETDMVCLADRLVKEDRFVGLDERIEYILNKAPKDPAVTERILSRKADTRALMDDIEKVIGMPLDQLLGEYN